MLSFLTPLLHANWHLQQSLIILLETASPAHWTVLLMLAKAPFGTVEAAALLATTDALRRITVEVEVYKDDK